MARLIDRLIRNPEAEWEDVMVMPLNIITRQSTDIYANNDPHIAEVLRYIHENISQKITVDDLVKLVPLSRRLLETRFKKGMGTSIYDYIIQTRIEKMMQLLCEGLSVSEAAARAGFLRHQERLAHVPPAQRPHPVGIPQPGRPEKALAPSRKQVSRPGHCARRSKFRHIGRFLRRIYYLRGKLTVQTEFMSLKPLFLFACTLCALPLMAQKNYTLTSPDGTLQATVATGSDLRISLSADGETLLAPSPVSMTLGGGEVLGSNPKSPGPGKIRPTHGSPRRSTRRAASATTTTNSSLRCAAITGW